MKKYIILSFVFLIFLVLTPVSQAAEAAKNTEKNVVILCYHQFTLGQSKYIPGKLANSYSISVKDFQAQMEQIRKEGYTVIPIDDYLAYLADKKDIPDKSVVITIDDGYKSFYTFAYPILKVFKYPATVYVYTNWIGSGKSAMNWDEVRELDKSGLITVGSHSRRHPYMTKPHFVDAPEYKATLHDEIFNSKAVIEKELGHPITTFAYPYGAYNEDTILEVIRSGYTAAVGVNSGANDKTRNEWALNRMIVRHDTGVSGITAMLHNKPIGVDYTLLHPYDGQAVATASCPLNVKIHNSDDITNVVYLFINGDDHTKELDLSKLNNGIITGSISGYKKGFNMITVVSRDKVSGSLREVSWSFFSK